jgi:tRNA A-37 threonylcarbamoyl transferase component Bud32
VENLIGVTIGNYQIVEQLGRGGMANVYKAYHPGLAVYRALKVIRPDLSQTQSFQERFQREARAVAGLRHHNIVQVHDFGQHEDLFYMVMEYVEGEDLKARIQREGPIRPFSEAVRIAEQVASGLGYAHERNILHRDVKPDNVLLAKDGTAILADFGIAKIVGSDAPQLTATGIGIGTPAYMAPELARGASEASPLADLYALGVVLYEMLTGRAPFTADTPLAVLHRVLHDPVPPPREFAADIPDALQGMVLKAMAFEPAHRYQNAAAMIEAGHQSLLGLGPGQPPQGGAQIAGAQATGAAVTRPAAAPPMPSEAAQAEAGASGGRNTLLAVGAIGLVLLALLGLAGFLGWRWYRSLDVRAAAESMLAELPTAQEEAGGAPADATTPDAAGAESGPPALSAGPSAEPVETPGPAAAEPATVPGSTVHESTVPGSAGAAFSGTTQTTARAGAGAVTPEVPATPDRTTSAANAGPGPDTSPDEPRGAPRGTSGARHGGTLRFGHSVGGEVEPEETVEYDLEVRRPATLYFDVVYATRPATYTLYDEDGTEVFKQLGNDLGPFRLERAGWYRLAVETDAEIPVRYEIEFRQVGG